MELRERISQNTRRRARGLKRSQNLSLLLMGATPFVVLGFDPINTKSVVFENLQECEDALGNHGGYCQSLEAELISNRHPEMAPRYASKSQCDADFLHIKNASDCRNGWCSTSNLSICESHPDGHFQPPLEGFLVDQDVLLDVEAGLQPNPAELEAWQLQPVYGLSDEALAEASSSDDDYHRTHSPFIYHYVAANGQYLGNQNLRGPLHLPRSQLAQPQVASQNHAVQRGGFGSTARQTMQAARS